MFDSSHLLPNNSSDLRFRIARSRAGIVCFIYAGVKWSKILCNIQYLSAAALFILYAASFFSILWYYVTKTNIQIVTGLYYTIFYHNELRTALYQTKQDFLLKTCLCVLARIAMRDGNTDCTPRVGQTWLVVHLVTFSRIFSDIHFDSYFLTLSVFVYNHL